MRKDLEGEGWDDKKFHEKFDASTWPSTVELGRNQGEGTDPWEQIPSIPEKILDLHMIHLSRKKQKRNAVLTY